MVMAEEPLPFVNKDGDIVVLKRSDSPQLSPYDEGMMRGALRVTAARQGFCGTENVRFSYNQQPDGTYLFKCQARPVDPF
jgi:hypothetical protein